VSKCACPTLPRLTHRVTIERPVYTQDAANEQIATWTPYASRYANCRAMTSREVVQSEQVQGSVGWIVEMRYDTKTIAITSGMRMKLNSFGNRVVYCDGPSMPVDGGKRTVRCRAMEQTA
jgi:SPP1 family predicted phage head-tail adaptor